MFPLAFNPNCFMTYFTTAIHLFVQDYLECDKYLLRSINRDMYLQKVCKSTLSSFQYNRFYQAKDENLP